MARKRKQSEREQRLAVQVAALTAERDELLARIGESERVVRVQQAEIDVLAAVVARNQARVEAETATAVRRRVDCERLQDANKRTG